MTLPATESRRVTGVKDGQLRWLRNQVLNTTCAMPECDEPTQDGHHIWPRSLIGNDSWLVEIETDAGKTVLPHVTGLCRAHHEAVERHDAWIKLEDGVFIWYDIILDTARTQADGHTNASWAGTPEAWIPLGPLSPQPGEKSVGKKKVDKPKSTTEGRLKEVYGVRIPKDEKENGHEVLEALVEAFVERYSEEMGWKASVPRYYPIALALAKGLQ